MSWNELDYSLQLKIMEKISELIEKENDPIMRDGIISALYELEVWSNSPCSSMEDERCNHEDYYDEELFVASASDWGNDDKSN